MKKTYLIFIALFFSLLLVNSVKADFPAPHIISTLDALETQPETNFKRICRSNLEVCLGFNICGADSTVVHYLTRSGKEIYRGTHTKKAVDNCFKLAGNDEQLQAGCIGWGLHLTQDPNSHGKNGYTSSSISKYKATNLMLHPVTERVYETYAIENSKYSADYINNLVSTNCDIFYKDPKYLKLLNEASGLTLDNDVQIAQTALSGQGKYSSEQIWGKKVDLPNWWYYLLIAIIIISLTAFLGIAIFGYRLRITLMIFWGIVLIISGVVLLSLILGTSFIWYNGVVDVFGWIISIPNIDNYIDTSFDLTKQYLDTGILRITDATGLDSYIGTTFMSGALSDAESTGKVLWSTIGIIFVLLLVGTTIISFVWKKKR